MNYKQWSETVEATESFEVNRETNRSVYLTPNNVQLIESTVFPYNVFKPNYSYVWVGLTLKDTKENNNLVKRYGGELQQEFYSEVGFMFPVFKELEQAYNFAMEQKENILKDFEKTLKN